jgi:hypothetical protein
MATKGEVMSEKHTRGWTVTQKIALGVFPPIAMSMIFAYVHWFMPILDLATASPLDMLFAQLAVLSPWVIMPAWGWGLFLLIFTSPAPQLEAVEKDIPPSSRDSWRGKLYRRLILAITFAATAAAVPETMNAGLSQWPLRSGLGLIATFILASLAIAFLRTHYARPRPIDAVDGQVVHRTRLEKFLYTADDLAGALALAGVALVAIHALMACFQG